MDATDGDRRSTGAAPALGTRQTLPRGLSSAPRRSPGRVAIRSDRVQLQSMDLASMAAPPLTLKMIPPTGEGVLRFVGDRIRFTLSSVDDKPLPDGWHALLRTNLGRGAVLRREIITSRGGEKPLSGASWRDIPMPRGSGNEWSVELTMTEVGDCQAS